MTIADALAVLDALAPPWLSMGDDPRGLLVGDPAAPTRSGIVVALDVTANVVEEAVARDAGLIVAHHPLIYHPLPRVRADEAHPGATVLACARAGIAVACAHTDWDVAPGGINDVLARLLDLRDTRPLQITYREPLVSLATFVPPTHRAAVMNALAGAGAGRIGDYDHCAFWTEGTGTFRPLDGAIPYTGTVGQHESLAEERLEMILPASRQDAAIAALRAVHPYEEPAFFVHTLANSVGASWGIGRVGTLPAPLSATAFQQAVKDALGFPEVRMVAPSADKIIHTVAVCGGAGGSLLPNALRAGADALVTADVRHHEYIDAQAQGIALLDAGHAQTEMPGTRELARRLEENLSGMGVGVWFVG